MCSPQRGECSRDSPITACTARRRRAAAPWPHSDLGRTRAARLVAASPDPMRIQPCGINPAPDDSTRVHDSSTLRICPVLVAGVVLERRRPAGDRRVSAAIVRARESGGSRPCHPRCRQPGARDRCRIRRLLPKQPNSTRRQRSAGHELAGVSKSSGWRLRRSSHSHRQLWPSASVRARARDRPAASWRAVKR